jgi:single-strand DNA-binding protein
MASFNRVILVGNLTRDVEMKYLQSGTAVAEVGLAVNDRRKNQQGEWIEEPVFVDITLWGRTAEIASEYLSKGSPVLIEGRLKYDTWEKDGQKRSKLRVVGESLQMLGQRSGGGGGGGGSSGGSGGGAQRPHSAPRFDESEYRQTHDEPAPARAAAAPPTDDIPF